MRHILVTIALLLGAVSLVDAKGKQVRYVGIHPLPKAEGGGMCYIEGPHVHLFAANKLEYRDHEGYAYFVGDPVAYNYEGPKHAYKGHHPIHVNVVVGDEVEDTEWCYLDGPHYHYFAEPEGPDFQVVGGAYFYVGTPPPVYVEARPAYVGINAVYRPYVYTRPVVTVAAPVGWIGAGVVVGGPGVVVAPPRAAVVAPGVHVHAGVGVVVPPPPSVHIGVGVSVGGGAVVVPGRVVKGKHKKFKHR